MTFQHIRYVYSNGVHLHGYIGLLLWVDMQEEFLFFGIALYDLFIFFVYVIFCVNIWH